MVFIDNRNVYHLLKQLYTSILPGHSIFLSKKIPSFFFPFLINKFLKRLEEMVNEKCNIWRIWQRIENRSNKLQKKHEIYPFPDVLLHSFSLNNLIGDSTSSNQSFGSDERTHSRGVGSSTNILFEP